MFILTKSLVNLFTVEAQSFDIFGTNM